MIGTAVSYTHASLFLLPTGKALCPRPLLCRVGRAKEGNAETRTGWSCLWCLTTVLWGPCWLPPNTTNTTNRTNTANTANTPPPRHRPTVRRRRSNARNNRGSRPGCGCNAICRPPPRTCCGTGCGRWLEREDWTTHNGGKKTRRGT